jgi:hypothetical protein
MERKEWRSDAPDLSVMALSERETSIAAHFGQPAVQNIGSTSGCGCDFPNVMFQNGDWPWFEDENEDEFSISRKTTEKYNRESLVKLLRHTEDSVVELYGVWDGASILVRRQWLTKKSMSKLYSPPRFASKSTYSTQCAWRDRSIITSIITSVIRSFRSVSLGPSMGAGPFRQ